MTESKSAGEWPEGLRVVRAQPRDLASLVEIREEAATWLESKRIEQWPVGMFVRTTDYVGDRILAGEEYLVYMRESVVGTVRLQWSDSGMWPDDDGEAGYVHGFAIRRAWAGKGIGRRVLLWCEAEVAATGREYLRLDCVAHNVRLVRYYGDAGFTRRGTVESRWGERSTVHQRFEKRVRAY